MLEDLLSSREHHADSCHEVLLHIRESLLAGAQHGGKRSIMVPLLMGYFWQAADCPCRRGERSIIIGKDRLHSRQVYVQKTREYIRDSWSRL